MSAFIPRNLTEIKAITGCTFACICNTVLCMFSCLQINCQPFYLRHLLKFYQFDWLIEIYLQTEGQGTHHKMVSLQPMSGFPSVSKASKNKRRHFGREAPQGNTAGDTSKIYPYPPADQICHYNHKYAFSKKYSLNSPPPPHTHTHTLTHRNTHIHIHTLTLMHTRVHIYKCFPEVPPPPPPFPLHTKLSKE